MNGQVRVNKHVGFRIDRTRGPMASIGGQPGYVAVASALLPEATGSAGGANKSHLGAPRNRLRSARQPQPDTPLDLERKETHRAALFPGPAATQVLPATAGVQRRDGTDKEPWRQAIKSSRSRAEPYDIPRCTHV